MNQSWTPVTETQLIQQIALEVNSLDVNVHNLWKLIHLPNPELWQQHPWGDECCGFWVLATFGRHCVYFNDITQSYALGQFEHWGRIADYRPGVDSLNYLLDPLVNALTQENKDTSNA